MSPLKGSTSGVSPEGVRPVYCLFHIAHIHQLIYNSRAVFSRGVLRGFSRGVCGDLPLSVPSVLRYSCFGSQVSSASFVLQGSFGSSTRAMSQLPYLKRHTPADDFVITTVGTSPILIGVLHIFTCILLLPFTPQLYTFSLIGMPWFVRFFQIQTPERGHIWFSSC